MENEAQLAAILGHEISHFLNRHAYVQIVAKNKQKSFGKMLGTAASLALAAGTGVQADLTKVGTVWADLVTSGYSRKLESQADAQGLDLLVGAQYPANEALPAFEALRIPEDNTANVNKVWSSHPDIDNYFDQFADLAKKVDGVSPYIDISLSQTESLPVNRSVSVSTYLLVGSFVGAGVAVFTALFLLSPKNDREKAIDVE